MQLQAIAPDHEADFLAMIEDYRAQEPKRILEVFGRDDWSPTSFKKFVKDSEKDRLDWRPGPNKVSLSRYVLVANDGTVGAYGTMQFPLDEISETDGGNLRVDVSPKWRERGLGTYCLNQLLFEASRAGLRRVLVTCEEENRYARKMIEKNRGSLEDVVASKAPGRKGLPTTRFWIRFE